VYQCYPFSCQRNVFHASLMSGDFGFNAIEAGKNKVTCSLVTPQISYLWQTECQAAVLEDRTKRLKRRQLPLQ
jgi:hypothetical protein